MAKAYLELNEIEQLESAAGYLRDRLLIRLLFHLGCRISEVITTEKYNWQENYADSSYPDYLNSASSKIAFSVLTQDFVPMRDLSLRGPAISPTLDQLDSVIPKDRGQ